MNIRILAFVCMTLIIGACALENRDTGKGDGFTIEGRMSGFPDSAKVTLVNANSSRKIDSTIVYNNRFRLKGSFADDEPGPLTLLITANQQLYYTNFFCGNNRVTITGDISDFPDDLIISGSPYQEQAEILRNETRDLEEYRDSLFQIYGKLSAGKEEGKIEEIRIQLDRVNREIKARRKKYIATHLDSYHALIMLSLSPDILPKDSLRILFKGVRPELRAGKYGKLIETYLNSDIVKTGDKYLDFSALERSGEEVWFSDYHDGRRYILLDFTSTYCPPCVLAAGELRMIHKRYNDHIRIISFTTDVKKELWKTFIKRDSVDWVSLWDGKGRFSPTYIRYGIKGVPTFIFIDPAGKVIDKVVGYGEGMLMQRLIQNNIIAAGEQEHRSM